MKYFYFHFIVTIGILLGAISGYAYDFQVVCPLKTSPYTPNELYFNILSETDKTVELTFKDKSVYGMDYTGLIEVPEKVVYKNVEYTVTTVGEKAFSRAEGLVSLTLPKTVNYIYCDFQDCKNLEYVLGIAEIKNTVKWLFYFDSPLSKNSSEYIYNQTKPFFCSKKFDEVRKYEVYAIGLTGARIGDRWGIIDRRGETIIPFEYEDFYQIQLNADWYERNKGKNIIICVKKNGKWGFIDIAGNVVLPFTKESAERAVKSKKTALNLVRKNSRIKPIYKEIQDQLDKTDVECKILISQWLFRVDEKRKAAEALAKARIEACRPVPYLDTQSRLWGFREKESKNGVVAPIYKQCINVGDCYLVSRDSITFGLLEEDAKTWVLNLKYTLSPVRGGYYYFDNEKIGLINSKGEVVLDCIYDDIVFAGKSSSTHYFYIIEEDKWGWADENSGVLQKCKYDGMGEWDDGKIEVFCRGYSGFINVLGQETEGVAKTLFNKAYRMNTATQAEQQLQYYLDVIEICTQTRESYAGLAYNNIGVIYENVGDREEALRYYDLARAQGDDHGRKNLRRLNGVIRSEKLSAVLNTLNQSLQNTSGNNTQGGENYIQNNSNSSSFSGGQGGGNYQNQYKMWERRAESNYRSLTNLGVSLKNTNTGERAGTTGQSMNTGNYVIMKKNLREAQNQMRSIRQKAQSGGVTIPQSSWETATVGY